MTLKLRILQANDRHLTEVNCPEWECVVWVRPMTGHERSSFLKVAVAVAGDDSALATRLVLLVACDQEGNRLFADEDFAALHAKSGLALDRISRAALKANGLDQDAVEAAKKN